MRTVPEYSKLDLKGNGHTQDSFSLVVEDAVRLLGKDVAYETIYCLSGNAFAPAIDLGEDCTAWWHVQGWQADRAMTTVAQSLGFRAERLELPPDKLDPTDAGEVFERKALVSRKKCASIIRNRMEEGAVIITDGGWRVRTEEGFAPWCWWGIITRATDGGDIRGTCLRADTGKATGFRDRPLDYLGGGWAISPGEQAPAADEVDEVVLRQAVARIRGDEPYTATKISVYGLDAMTSWIEQMATVPFCASCADAGSQGMAGCAVNNVQTLSAGARSAASYLHRIAPKYLGEAGSHLETAAKHYDRIVTLLTPATWEFYHNILNDSDKQKAHAKTALTPVKAELAAAADAIERSLVAMEGKGA